ncbi:MAG: DUF6691 family protein [Solirubrobacterales bacterium]
MKVKAFAVGFGALFGFLISWGQFTDPDRIRQMLLLEDLYLYVMMFSAIAVGLVGLRLLRRRGVRSVVGRSPIAWVTERPRRDHVVGAAIFGAGWAIADTCPAPVAGQLAQGVGWSLFTIAGILIGIELYLRRAEAPAPDADPEGVPAPPVASGAAARG